MAVKQNASEEEVASAGVQLWTGIAPFKVLAVNPNLKELHEMDIMFQTEPKYEVKFENTGEANKIVFWLGNEDAKVPLEIIVTPGPWKAKKNDKVQWLNKSGQSTWGEVMNDGSMDPEAIREWHEDPDTFYQCPRGIDVLIEFIKAWANVAPGDEVFLDTYDKIANGDMKEIRALIKVLKENQARVLVYVRDGKYQAVYNRHFGRVRPERDDLFIKALNKDYGEITGDYTIPWGEYKPGVIQPDATAKPVGQTSDDEDWVEGGADDLQSDEF